MENNLLEKIEQKLDEKNFSESDVVFIMSKIRKIIEKNNLKENLWVLNFYCDWMSHLSMARSTAKRIIRSIEDKLGAGGITKENLHFIKFDNLKEELNIFLKKYGLPVLIDGQWKLFRDAVLETVIDCPLQKSDGLIKKLYFTSQNNNITNAPYEVDGKIINLTLEMGDDYRHPETNAKIKTVSISFIDGTLKM